MRTRKRGALFHLDLAVRDGSLDLRPAVERYRRRGYSARLFRRTIRVDGERLQIHVLVVRERKAAPR